MLKEKFTYNPLERVTIKGTRHYQTPGGQPLPSVTSVLDALKDKTGLYEWRKRVGNEEADRIMRLATGIGTQVHLHLEKYILEEDRPNGSNLIHQMARELSEIVIEKGLSNLDEVWGTEVPLYYPELYAGTTDLVGVYKGEPAIMDFKQARRLKKKEWVEDYYLQLVAYAEAHNKQYDTQIKSGRIFICTQANEYQTFEIDNYDQWVGKWYGKLEEYYKLIL